MLARHFGEVPEWLKGLAWKVSIRSAYRGFESLSLRQFLILEKFSLDFLKSLCNTADKNSPEALFQKKIIDEVINE